MAVGLWYERYQQYRCYKGYEGNDKGEMETGGKRTVQVNVKMSTEDFSALQSAANALWPDAILSDSGILLWTRQASSKGCPLEKDQQKTRIIILCGGCSPPS